MTLTGPGGCGKTRLLLEALRGPLARTGEHRWWVNLEPAADAPAITRLIADAAGLASGGDLSVDTLAAALGTQRVILALDTCEHVLGHTARLVHQLINRCPAVRVLVTSQEALAVPGEMIVPVPALSLPAARDHRSRKEVCRAEAVRLLVERVRVVAPDVAFTDGDLGAVAELCAELDGLPLAIELAASRMAERPVAEIAPVLRADDRAAAGAGPAGRHGSLRAVADRGYRLLSPGHQAVLRRLSVLPRDVCFDVAEAACVGGDVSAREIPGLLADLAAKSLIGRSPEAPDGAIRQFETLRWYARERLAAAGELAATRERLIAWLSDRAEEFVRTAFVPERTQRWIEARHECLALAVGWTAEAGDGRHAALAAMSGWRSARAGAFEAAEAVLRGALRMAPPAEYLAVLRAQLAVARFGAGARTAGIRGLRRAIAAHERAGNSAGAAAALVALGAASGREGAWVAAQRHFTDALAALTERGDRIGIAACRQYLAWLAARRGDTDRAQRFIDDALPVLRAHGEWRLMAFGLCAAGTVALIRGDPAAAESMFFQAIECGGDDELAPALDGLAAAAARTGRYQRTIVLRAGAERFARTLPTSPWHSLFADEPTGPAAVVDADEFSAPQRLSWQLTRGQLVDYAYRATTANTPLSARENQVAEFVAAGLTNGGVAARLRISEQTVGSHITSIFSKLEIRSRCELATWLAARASA